MNSILQSVEKMLAATNKTKELVDSIQRIQGKRLSGPAMRDAYDTFMAMGDGRLLKDNNFFDDKEMIKTASGRLGKDASFYNSRFNKTNIGYNSILNDPAVPIHESEHSAITRKAVNNPIQFVYKPRNSNNPVPVMSGDMSLEGLDPNRVTPFFSKWDTGDLDIASLADWAQTYKALPHLKASRSAEEVDAMLTAYFGARQSKVLNKSSRFQIIDNIMQKLKSTNPNDYKTIKKHYLDILSVAAAAGVGMSRTGESE